MDGFCRQKGVEDALDHRCDSLNSVVVGISRWLCGWWTHSCPIGRCHHRRGDPSYSGTKVKEGLQMKKVLMIVMLIIAMGLLGCPHNRGHDYDRDRHDQDRGRDYEHHDHDNDDREHRK